MRTVALLGFAFLLGCSPAPSFSRVSSGALRSFSLSDYCLGPALTVSWEPGSFAAPVALAADQLDSALHRAACCDTPEDVWVSVDDTLSDVGFGETSDSVSVDFLRLHEIFSSVLPYAPALLIHTHPLPTDEVYPPSSCDFVTSAVASHQFFLSPGVFLQHRVYDCYGVWEYRLSSSAAHELGLLSGTVDANALPARAFLEDRLESVYPHLFDTNLSRQERVDWWLAQAPSYGLELSYRDLRSVYGPFEE